MDLNKIPIIENIDDVDVTEPAAMDILLARLDEIEQEDQEYMELLLKKLDGMVITWEQPWYQRTKCLTRPVKKDHDDEDANNKRETFRTDSFTLEESKIVRKNWKKFRKAFRLPDKPICIARWKNKSHTSKNHDTSPHERVRHFVISFLAQGLERNLYQVNRHFLTEYGGPVKGPYTEYDEKIIEIYFLHSSKNAVVYLSALLSREPRNIYKRLYQMLNEKPESKKKIKWELPLATEFLQKLMKHSGCSLKQLKNRKFEMSVWNKLQEDMNQPYYKLQLFWYRKLHVVLFVKSDVTLTRLGRKLMKVLRSSDKYQVWTDIRWKDVAKKFPNGFTPAFLRGVAYRLARSYQVPNHKWLTDPLPDVVSHTLHQLKTTRRKQYRLKNLTFNSEGMLEHIKYDVKIDYGSINS